MGIRMNRSLVLCADDFGMSSGINRAIIELIAQKRLSATSCMTTMPAWDNNARALLLELRGQAAIGLHFNLTEGHGSQPLGKLILSSLLPGPLHRLDEKAILQILERQLDRFEQTLDIPPDFVDGHQHIQMFPQIRRITMHLLQRRYGLAIPWIRISQPPLRGHDAASKALMLRLLGTGFLAELRQRGLRGTCYFSGMYSLQPDADFAGFMDRWLRVLPAGGLLMCHPGYASDAPLTKTREMERRFLASDRFADLLRTHNRQFTTSPALL